MVFGCNTVSQLLDQCNAVLQKYKQLVSEGRFQETLLEMYRWGKQNGWDPAAKRIAAAAATQ